MKLSYSVLWFEDDRAFYGIASRKLEEYLEDEYAFSYEPKPYDVKEYTDLDGQDFSHANLVLVDLNLTDHLRGNELIKHLREKSIYAPTVLYSSSGIMNVFSAMQEARLDGVYCATREELFPKLKMIISATISRMQNLNNLRGFVIGECSALEQKMQSVLQDYENKTGKLKAHCNPIIKEIEDGTKKKLKCKYSSQSCTHKLRKKSVENLVKNEFNSATNARLIDKVMEEVINYKDFKHQYDIIRKARNQLAHAEEDVKSGSLILKDGTTTAFTLEDMKNLRNKIRELRSNINSLAEAVGVHSCQFYLEKKTSAEL